MCVSCPGKKRSGALAAAPTPKSSENRKDGGGTSTQYYGKLNWAVPAKKVMLHCIFSNWRPDFRRGGTSNRITKFDAHGRRRCGGHPAASKCSDLHRVRLSERVFAAFIQSFSFPGAGSHLDGRGSSAMKKSRSLLPLMMVRRDAPKPVHKLANIDPRGTATASRTGLPGTPLENLCCCVRMPSARAHRPISSAATRVPSM